MMTAAEFDALMGELGPMDEAIDEVVRDTDERWIVRLAGVDVAVEFDGEAQRVRLGTEIGVPRPAIRGDLYERLLVYNVAGRETGDVVMSLSGPRGTVMQLLTLPAPGLTARELVTPVVNLAERTPFWRAIVVAGVEAADDDAPASDFVADHFIRA